MGTLVVKRLNLRKKLHTVWADILESTAHFGPDNPILSKSPKPSFPCSLSVCISVCVRVCSFYILHYSPQESLGRGLLSCEYKFTKLILQFICPSYHLTSQRKSTLTQRPSVFNHHRIAENTKSYLDIKCINKANGIAYLYWE